MSNTPQPLPVNLQQSPDVPLPPAIQAMLQNAQQGASQPPQSPVANIPPITSTPEYQAVQQAGQSSLGVPGYNDQGQPTPAVGVKDRLKRALSDAIFAIGEGFTYGPGAGIMAATPQGREYVHQQRQLEAEQAKAQQMQELGMAQGRLYQGMGRIGEAQAAQQRAGGYNLRAQAYAQLVPALANKYNMQAGHQRYVVDPRTQGLFDTVTQRDIPYDPSTGEGIFTLTPEMVSAAQKMGLVGKNFEPGDYGPKMYDRITNAVMRAQGTQTTMGGIIPTVKTAQGVKATGGPSLGTSPMQVFAQTSQGRLGLANKSFERDTFGTLFGKNIPGSLLDEQGNVIGWKSPAAPTSTIKTQGQQAQDLSILFNQVRGEITKLDEEGKLGPYHGRISELMVGKIGYNDPDFAKLRALGSLTSSGMLKAHFGARGGQLMYDHFQNLFDTGKMTAGNLIGALDGFSTFMNQYAKRVRTVSQTPSGGSNNQGGQVPGGPKTGDTRIYQGHTYKFNGSMWIR